MSELYEPSELSEPPQWAIFVPKKRQGPQLDALKAKKQKIFDEEKKVKKAIKARGLFGEEFFRNASRAESLTLQRLQATSAISYSEFEGELPTWSNEDAVKNLFTRMRAAEYRAKSFQKRSEALATDKETAKGRLRAVFMKLFTSAKCGLDIRGAGEGPRDKQMQTDFRNQLLRGYDAVDEKGGVWCPVMQGWYHKSSIIAAHIFSYKHGQDVMDEIFGKTQPCELFSPKNGLLIHQSIEAVFDKGYFVIVPDVEDLRSLDKIRAWLMGDVRDYKIRIIDSSWDQLNYGISGERDGQNGLKWRDLDNRKLVFRNSTRPAARYLYFHYCLQLLRRAWKISPDKDQGSVGEAQAASLQEEFGQYVWATSGRYIGRKMLRALVDTLGHRYEELMRGASMNVSSPDSFMDAITKQISDSKVTCEQSYYEESEDETRAGSEMDTDDDYFSL